MQRFFWVQYIITIKKSKKWTK